MFFYASSRDQPPQASIYKRPFPPPHLQMVTFYLQSDFGSASKKAQNPKKHARIVRFSQIEGSFGHIFGIVIFIDI